MKEIYKYVEMECGDLYVIMTGTGITQQTGLLHVNNWDITVIITVSLMSIIIF